MITYGQPDWTGSLNTKLLNIICMLKYDGTETFDWIEQDKSTTLSSRTVKLTITLNCYERMTLRELGIWSRDSKSEKYMSLMGQKLRQNDPIILT